MSGSQRSCAASVLVPTHDHAATLDLAVRSALEQTVTDLEVLIVGDGVGDDTRAVVDALTAVDDRVRWFDFEKGPRHGEIYRGRAIDEARGAIICYLSDDDLFFPDHVEVMLDLLADHDLAQSLNGYLVPDGSFAPYVCDLSSPACREWHLHGQHNGVSITGTAHTTGAYRRLPYGWRTAPEGVWVDHYMWCQFLEQPWLRAATSNRVTALQFPSHVDGRADWSADERRAELLAAAAALHDPKWLTAFDADVRRALMASATDHFVARSVLLEQLDAAGHERFAAEQERDAALARGAALRRDLDWYEVELRLARAELVDRQTSIAAMEQTRTWRWRTAVVESRAFKAVTRATYMRRAPRR